MKEAVIIEQLHGDKIVEVSERPDSLPQGDALITRQPNLTLMVRVADCQGVIIKDPKHKVVAAVHSGWRGSTCNIIGKTIQRMKEKYGSEAQDLQVSVSPSLGPCCAEFSDPRNELPAFCHRFIDERNHVDFWALTKAQLREEGIPEQNIELAGKCTKCQPGYYSHRNGDSERMGVFVKLN